MELKQVQFLGLLVYPEWFLLVETSLKQPFKNC